ncbi:hypothetical protein E2557_11990, partial [Staphylococcus petrasii]
QCKMYLGHVKVLLGMFLSLKTLYRKRTVIWPFYFYTIIRTLSEITKYNFRILFLHFIISNIFFQSNLFFLVYFYIRICSNCVIENYFPKMIYKITIFFIRLIRT